MKMRMGDETLVLCIPVIAGRNSCHIPNIFPLDEYFSMADKMTPYETYQQRRVAFEKWATMGSDPYDIWCSAGEYVNPETLNAWLGWQGCASQPHPAESELVEVIRPFIA